jgi:hypothetical protein
VARAVGLFRTLQIGDEPVQALLEAPPLLGREPDVDQSRRVVLVGISGGDELVGCLSQHRRREHASLELLGHSLVALEHEQSRDPPVVLLRQRAHLARADDTDQPRRLEHFQVVPDRSLGRLEHGCQLTRACRALAQHHHDARAGGVTEGAKLLRILDDEDVVELVVGITGDDRETYGKYRPFVNLGTKARP